MHLGSGGATTTPGQHSSIQPVGMAISKTYSEDTGFASEVTEVDCFITTCSFLRMSVKRVFEKVAPRCNEQACKNVVEENIMYVL